MKLEVIYIPLEKIVLDESVENRGPVKDLESESSFLNLVKSIKTTNGVVHPISVNETTPPEDGEEFGVYTIIAGTKRYLAYKALFQDLMLSGFSTMPSFVYKVSQAKANVIKRHENQFRSNPSNENIFEFHVSAIPFLFELGKFGEKEINFEKGMEILGTYIALEVLQTKKRSAKSISKKQDELRTITRAANPISALKAHFRTIGESPLYFWNKRKIFEYDARILKLYIEKRISFNLAANMNKAMDDKIPGINRLISFVVKDENVKRSEITSRLQKLLDESQNKLLPEDSEKVDNSIKTFRKINKMLKSKRKNVTIKQMNEIDEHTDKILKILKGEK